MSSIIDMQRPFSKQDFILFEENLYAFVFLLFDLRMDSSAKFNPSEILPH